MEGGLRNSSGHSIPAAPNMNASVPSIESSAKSFKSACLDRATHKNKVDEKLKAIFEPKQKNKKQNSSTNASKNLTSQSNLISSGKEDKSEANSDSCK